jgi:hypothetical protein
MWRFFIVKFHIVQAGETLDFIKKKYNMDDKEFSLLNPDSGFKQYSIGDRVRVKDSSANKIVKDIENIYSSKGISKENREKKYICPHCKNIIIIPD